jgi:protein-S-isoprenylcysteine O-methyltransferase Ste14
VIVLWIPALGWRLLDEERLLVRDLAGYGEYRQTVPWRLIPFLW